MSLKAFFDRFKPSTQSSNNKTMAATNSSASSTSPLDWNLVDTLVFEGGGVKGIAYVGGLKALELYFQEQAFQKNPINQIKTVAGTSAGAIMSLLVALNLDVDEINVIMSNTSFSSFEDAKSGWLADWGNTGKAAAIYRNGGYLCEGEVFKKWVEDLLKEHAGNPHITFADLMKFTKQNKKGKCEKDLHVYAIRLNDHKIVDFCAQKTPNISVSLAMRMTMSIPLFFEAVQVKEDPKAVPGSTVQVDTKGGKIYYVDGGLKANYPYPQILDFVGNPNRIFGFRVDSKAEILTLDEPKAVPFPDIDVKSGIELIPHIAEAGISAQEDVFYKDKIEQSRTVRCWDANISTVKFDLDETEINKLLASGAVATSKFLYPTNYHPLYDKTMNALKVVPSQYERFLTNYTDKEFSRINQLHANAEALPEEVKKNTRLSLTRDISRISKNIKRVIPKF